MKNFSSLKSGVLFSASPSFQENPVIYFDLSKIPCQKFPTKSTTLPYIVR